MHNLLPKMPTINQVSDDDSSFLAGSNTGSPGSGEELVYTFTKQMLQGRLFIGTFQEKRHVDSLQSYRSVIVIGPEETDLIRDLEVVRKRLYNHYKQSRWIGITGPDMIGAPVGCCLWVELPEEVFGSFWYKISKIKFRVNEILLRLKAIRPVTTNVVASTNTSPQNVKTNNVSDLSVYNMDYFMDLKNNFVNSFNSGFNTILTIHNTKEAVKFLSVLIVALATGLLRLIEFLGDFTIRLMREMSVLIKATTPIFLSCIDLIGKIIGGFYLLILGMWRDRKGPAPPAYQSPYNSLSYGDKNRYNSVYFSRGLPAPNNRKQGRRVTITPLN